MLESVADAQELCKKFSAHSNFKFCPGIDSLEYESQYHDPIRFNIRSVQQTTQPFSRVDSVNCKLWFELASNATSAERGSKEVRCSACKRLVTDLKYQKKITLSESPSRKLNGSHHLHVPD